MPRNPNPVWLPDARERLAEGMTRRDVAEALGVSYTRLCDVLRAAGDGREAVPAQRAVYEQNSMQRCKLPWPRGKHQLGFDPFNGLTERERDVIARAAPEAAMWAIATARGLPL